MKSAGRNEEILHLPDNLSFGPIAATDRKARIRWMEEELGYAGWPDVTDAAAVFLEAFAAATGPATVWTSWHETCSYAGFLWFLSKVGDAPLSVVTAGKLSLIREAGMIELLGRGVPLAADDRARHQARWRQLESEDAPLRIINGDELVSAPVSYFDDALLGRCEPRWQKMARIVAGVLVEFYDAGIRQTGDLVLGARLASLARSGRLEWQGDLGNMRHCEMRLPAGR